MSTCLLSQKMQDAINEQINDELEGSYLYLHMSSFCNSIDFPGFSAWLRAQSEEEYGHAMKLFEFLEDYDGKIVLKGIDAPKVSYDSLLEVFERALQQEQTTTKSIHDLYELAQEEKAYALQAQLQWFLIEQVEEEKSARDLLARLNFVNDSPAGMLQLDLELGGGVGVDESGSQPGA